MLLFSFLEPDDLFIYGQTLYRKVDSDTAEEIGTSPVYGIWRLTNNKQQKTFSPDNKVQLLDR